MIKYGLLTAPDTMGVEYEVAAFLHGLVRLLKPRLAIETGCGEGYSSKAILKAIEKNEHGYLVTCDNDPKFRDTMEEWNGSAKRISAYPCSAIELCDKMEPADFAFIDSSGDRVAVVEHLRLNPGAVMVLHDSKRPQYRPIWTLKPWRSIWEIDTEQGLAVFQL